MKRNLGALTIVVLAIALVPGCQKGDEYKINHGVAELKNCPIMQINSSQFGSTDTSLFTYNAWGDPASVIKLPSPGTGNPNYYFRYDKKRRLTDIIGLYSDGWTGEIWHKYFYDNPGSTNIIKDSTYFGIRLQNNELEWAYEAWLTFYTYDKYDRIIKDSTSFSTYAPMVNNYSYDVNGNMIGRTYDNKVNILRTNKIWMFYSRDYSINNAFVAVDYNSRGLPTQLNLSTKDGIMHLLGNGFYNAQITYGCR